MKKILILLVAILVAFFSWNTLKDKEKETSEDQLSHNNNLVIQKDEIDESGNVIEDNIIVEDNKTTEEDNKITEEDNKTTEEDKDKETTKEEEKKEENKQENNNNTSNNKPAPAPTPTPVTYGKVVINYVDEQGVKIADSTTDAQAKVGSTYNYKAPAIAGYISEKTEASVSISKNNETKEVTFVYGNQDYAPYISTYYIKPTVKTGENVVIKFYVTDYYQKEYRSEDTSKTFNITIKANGKAQITKTVKAGVHEINIGSFASEGKVDFSLIATDQFGRNSHELFNYFRVHNGTIKKAYTMTQADLTKYNIKNNDNYAIRKYIDVPEISDNIVATMTEAYNNEVVPSGKYVVLIPRNINDNNKFGHKLYNYVR
ncbi:MAG: MucBP domain-containing protein, partial [Bacilli bacterium]|nr:MucBP domain-containing protein [Bacilli bacterium]